MYGSKVNPISSLELNWDFCINHPRVKYNHTFKPVNPSYRNPKVSGKGVFLMGNCTKQKASQQKTSSADVHLAVHLTR